MASKCSRRGKRSRRDRSNVQFLQEDIVHEILSWLPLHKVFQVQSVCHLWRRIVCSSEHFHKLWEERNSRMWLIMNHCKGDVALFNKSSGRWFNKEILGSSCWRFRAAAGSFLLYSNKNDGMLQVINPLTMESRRLPDPLLRHRGLSFYMNRSDHYRVSINLNVDETAGTYQVIVLGNFSEILIYKSAELSWEIKNTQINFRDSIIGKLFPYETACNQADYCFPLHLHAAAFYNVRAFYNVSGKKSGKIVHIKDGCDVDCVICYVQGKNYRGGNLDSTNRSGSYVSVC